MLTLCLLAGSAWAQAENAAQAAAPAMKPIPPADELKRALDYLEAGKESGPALLDVIPCLKVDQTKGSPTMFTCLEPVTGPLKKGATVQAWTHWFCPKDGKYEDVTIQFLLDGEVRSTNDVTVSGYGRTRTWRGQNLSKPGKWQVKVLRGGKELGTANIVVEK